MNIPTRKSLWDVFKQRLETVNTTAQKVTQFNPLYQMTRGTLNVPKTMVQDIASIKKGTTYTPSPTNLPVLEQIKWNEQQSQEAKRAMLGIQRTVGGLQMGLQSYAPTSLGVSAANYIQKKRGLPSPILKPEDIKIPTIGKIGINIAGGVASYITIGSAVGNFMKGSAVLQPLIQSSPKLARTAQFIATAGSIDQLKAPIDSLMSERSKIFAKNLPSYFGMGYAFATPTLRQAIPSAFIGQYISSKLGGKSNQDAFKESLTSASIVSLLKVPSIYNRISVTKQLQNQAREVLGVNPNASNLEIRQAYYDKAAQYHRGGYVEAGGNRERFDALVQAQRLLLDKYVSVEKSSWEELKTFYNYLKSNEGKSMALSIINEMPVGMSINAVSPETPTPKPITPITNVLPITKDLVGSTDEAGNVLQGISQSGKDYVVKYLLPRTGKVMSIIKPTMDEALAYAKNLFINPAPLNTEKIPIKPTPTEIPAPQSQIETLKKSLQEGGDVVDDILTGKVTMKIPSKDVKTDWRESLGRGIYMKIFRKDGLYTSDELATDNGMTEDELKNALMDRIRGREGIKTQITGLEETAKTNLTPISEEVPVEPSLIPLEAEIPPVTQKGGVEAIQPTPNLIAQPTPKPLLQGPAQAPTIPLGGQTPTIPLGVSTSLPSSPEDIKIDENFHTPTKPTKVGLGFQKAGIQQGVNVEDVAQFTPLKQSPELDKASQFIRENPQRFKDILLGTQALPTDINLGSFVNASNQYVKEVKDPDLYQLIANSDILTKTSEAAQILGALPETNEYSPEAVIKDVKKTRAEVATKQSPKGIDEKKLAKELDESIKKATLQRLFEKTSKYSPLINAIKSGELTIPQLVSLDSADRISLLSKYIGIDALEANLDFEKKFILKDIDKGIMNWVHKWGKIGRYSGSKIPEIQKAKEIWKKEQFARTFDPKSYQPFLRQLASKIMGTDISSEEASTIFKLSEDISSLRTHWTNENGWDSKANQADYGATTRILEKYTDVLKGTGNIKDLTLSRIAQFKSTWGTNKPKALIDLLGDGVKNLSDLVISLKATWDDSFIGRQGIKILYTNPKMWFKSFGRSITTIGKTLKNGNDDVWDAVVADYNSRDNSLNGAYKDAKIFPRVFERYPSQMPEKVWAIGRVFRASEVAFKATSLEMKMNTYDLYSKIAEGNGADMTDKYQRESMGTVATSLSGQGKWGRVLDKTLHLFFWAPKMLKGNIDVLTGHAGQDLSPEAKKIAAKNIIKIISSVATILLLSKLMDKDAVDFDPRGAYFGCIMIGPDHKIPVDITGGAMPIIVLATRLAMTAYNGITGSTTPTFKSYTTGKLYDTAHPQFGEPNTTDIMVNFLTGKATPLIHVFLSIMNQDMYGGKRPTAGRIAETLFTPISVENIWEIKNAEPYRKAAATVSAILDVFGFNSNAPIRSIKFDAPSSKEINRLQKAGYDNVQTSYISGFLQENKLLTVYDNEDIFKHLTSLSNNKLEILFNSDVYQNLSEEKKAKMLAADLQKCRDVTYLSFLKNRLSGLSSEDFIKEFAKYKKAGILTKSRFIKLRNSGVFSKQELEQVNNYLLSQ